VFQFLSCNRDILNLGITLHLIDARHEIYHA
jgi:hypothetical protein